MRQPHIDVAMFLDEPFKAKVNAKSTHCVLHITDPNDVRSPLTLFFKAAHLDQVKRIADLLNEISAPAKEREAA